MALDGTATVITVTTNSELQAAYKALAGADGGTILLDSQGDFRFHLSLDPAGDAPVTITSLDPDNPATVHKLELDDLSNLTIDNIHLNSEGVERDSWVTDFSIDNCSNIIISNSTFESNGNGMLLKGVDQPDVSGGGKFGNIENSDGILFTGNEISGYFHALGIMESSDVQIVDNDIHHLQGDGIRMAGVTDIEIVDNYLHDFYGSTQDKNHSDMLQIWGHSTETVSGNILITGNVFDAGDGAASQTIFIANEWVGTTGNYHDITITDNVVYNGMPNGIVVSHVDGLEVSSNTVLWNKDAESLSTAGSDPNTSPPKIRIIKSTDVIAEDNIAFRVIVNGETADGNYQVSYGDPRADNYVGNHFVNPEAGASAELQDLTLRADSDLIGMGAEDSQPILTAAEGAEALVTYFSAANDAHVKYFDASLSVDTEGTVNPDDYDFTWKLSNGVELHGVSAVYDYDGDIGEHSFTLELAKDGVTLDTATYGFELEDKTIFDINFEDGLVDSGWRDLTLNCAGGADNLVEGASGTGFLIGGEDEVKIVRNSPIHNLNTFALNMDMRLIDASDTGVFMDFQKVMSARVIDGGYVTFRLGGGEGATSITSDVAVFDDTDFHTLGIGWDGVTGQLEMFADGESVGSGELFGMTAPRTSFGLIFGNTFNGSIDAVVDNLYMSTDPTEAGLVREFDPADYAPPPAAMAPVEVVVPDTDPVVAETIDQIVGDILTGDPVLAAEPVVVSDPAPEADPAPQVESDPVLPEDTAEPEPEVAPEPEVEVVADIQTEVQPEVDPVIELDPQADVAEPVNDGGSSSGLSQMFEAFFSVFADFFRAIFGGGGERSSDVMDAIDAADASTDASTDAGSQTLYQTLGDGPDDDDVSLFDLVQDTGQIDDTVQVADTHVDDPYHQGDFGLNMI